MNGLLARIRNGLRQSPLALFVLAVGLALAVAAWRLASAYVDEVAENAFRMEATMAAKAVDRRLRDVTNLLLGVKGLFNASEQVTRNEFEQFLKGYELREHQRGMRLVSYSRLVDDVDREHFEKQVRRDTSLQPGGYPDFTITPPGQRARYLVVEYVHPMAGNEQVFGLDLLADAARAAHVLQGRDRGEILAAPLSSLILDPGRFGIVMRISVYRREMPVSTVEERRRAFKGVVGALIHLDELMDNLLGPRFGAEFDLVIEDFGPTVLAQSEPLSQANVLFDSHNVRPHRVAHGPGRFEHNATLDVAGRTWRLSFTSIDNATAPGHTLPLVVLFGGIGMSVLLCWLVWSLSVARSRALQLADSAGAVRAAADTRAQLQFIQGLIETVPQPIFFKDWRGAYLGVNKAWERIFGIGRAQFIGKTVFELYPDDPQLAARHHAKDQELFKRPGSQSYEATIVAADGRTHHTIYNKATFNAEDGTVAGLIGTITDVTDLKRAEAALRESEARFRDLTELSSDWYWEQDAQFRMTLVSSKVDDFNLDGEAAVGKLRWEIPDVEISEEQKQAHLRDLEARRPFRDFVYRRYDKRGALRTVSVSGRPIYDSEGRFKGYRGIGRDITEQRLAEERIRHLAHHDALTGLPNRALLNDRITRAIMQARRDGRVVVVMFIDLDRFKTVNDSLGHHIGDRLLRMVAERLASCIRTTDTVARIGGDEYVIVLTDFGSPQDASQVAQKVIDALSRTFSVEGHDLHVTPSVGICAYPQDGEEFETLMRNADAAMYHAKEMGRNNYQYFTQEMNVAARERLTIENDLRRALDHGQFVLHYQPLFDLRSGRIVGFEALVRWLNPRRGLVFPGEFIGVAEETGLISPLGEWVLREACRQAQEWRKAGHDDLKVAVNCSAQQFRRGDMVEVIRAVLRDTGLPASCLELEITESVIIHHAEQVIDSFDELHRMGAKLSIDDFGTGYSSLSYLKRFPIDGLKVDRSFVRDISHDPDDAAIVTAIIAMAHGLELQVVAEGVETAEQVEFLTRLGCDHAQGYYLGSPLPAAEFTELLRKSRRATRAARP